MTATEFASLPKLFDGSDWIAILYFKIGIYLGLRQGILTKAIYPADVKQLFLAFSQRKYNQEER